jgi:hypothetical protein
MVDPMSEIGQSIKSLTSDIPDLPFYSYHFAEAVACNGSKRGTP